MERQIQDMTDKKFELSESINEAQNNFIKECAKYNVKVNISVSIFNILYIILGREFRI